MVKHRVRPVLAVIMGLISVKVYFVCFNDVPRLTEEVL